MEATQAKGTVTAGAAFVHRFYMRRSLKDFEPKVRDAPHSPLSDLTHFQNMAPVMLFLASKIEEVPLRLRYIVNACLAKFEPGAPQWTPELPPAKETPQPLEYGRWEREVLAAEEIALDALCFDMVVQQPWPILWRAVRGLNELWEEGGLGGAGGEGGEAGEASTSTVANGTADRKGKGKSRATEAVVTELGWTLLNEGSLAPLPILYPAPVLAMAAFALALALVDQQPLHVAIAATAELGAKFGLDTDLDPARGATGDDAQAMREAVAAYVAYCEQGVIDRALAQYFDKVGWVEAIVAHPQSEPAEGTTYTRRFKVLPQADKAKDSANASVNANFNANATASTNTTTNGQANGVESKA